MVSYTITLTHQYYYVSNDNSLGTCGLNVSQRRADCGKHLNLLFLKLFCYTYLAREFSCTKKLAFRFEDLLDIRMNFF